MVWQNDSKRPLVTAHIFMLQLWGDLTLSWRRPLSYRNQCTDFLRKSMDWFLYHAGPYHERVKCDFRNLFLVSHVKLRLFFDQPQIKNADRISLHQFHQQLRINNSWILSMGYEIPILSNNDNLKNTTMRLPSFLCFEFFNATKNSNM